MSYQSFQWRDRIHGLAETHLHCREISGEWTHVPTSPHPLHLPTRWPCTYSVSKDSSPLTWGSLTILPLTLGNATKELELHGQAEQVAQEWHPDTLHTLSVLVLKPAMAVDYGLIHHICGKETAVSGASTPWAGAWLQSPPHLLRNTPHKSSATWSSARTSSVWIGGVSLWGLRGSLHLECPWHPQVSNQSHSSPEHPGPQRR